MEQPSKEELIRGIDNSSAREQTFRVNTDKRVVITTLLGLDKKESATAKDISIAGLFTKYFKQTVNKVYTIDDINNIADILTKAEIFAKAEERTAKIAKIKSKSFSVSKGNYSVSGFDNTKAASFVFINLGDSQYLIGASSSDKAVWFLFTNDKSDVNNGFIFARHSAVGSTKQFCSFEINPFVSHTVPVTDKETGIAEDKNILTFNPSWLVNTISNMEQQLFASKK